jgi:hypothetical protein
MDLKGWSAVVVYRNSMMGPKAFREQLEVRAMGSGKAQPTDQHKASSQGIGLLTLASSCSSFFDSIRSICPYLDAAWSRSGQARTRAAQTWSTISRVLMGKRFEWQESDENVLEHILLGCRSRISSFQSKYSTINKVHEIPRRQISQDTHLSKSQADLQDLGGGINRFVDVQCIWRSRRSCKLVLRIADARATYPWGRAEHSYLALRLFLRWLLLLLLSEPVERAPERRN